MKNENENKTTNSYYYMNYVHSNNNQAIIREYDKLNSGEYIKIPDSVIQKLAMVGIAINPEHILHCSQSTPGKIAYCPSSQYAANNRQIRSSLSKYLNKYHNIKALALNAQDYGFMVGAIKSSLYTLHFATTLGDWISIYQVDGIEQSCMGYSSGYYNTDGIHPVTVYNYPDNGLMLAYVKNHNDEIIARAIVRHVDDAKYYNRCYGQIEIMQGILNSEGYRENINYIRGAKLALLKNDNNEIVCPYIDKYRVNDPNQWEVEIDEYNDCLIVTNCGYSSDYRTGLLEYNNHENETQCAHCSDFIDDEYINWIGSNSEPVCDSCLSYNFVFCDNVEEYIHESDCEIESTYDGSYIVFNFDYFGFTGYVRIESGDILNVNEAVYSDYNGAWYRTDEVVYSEHMDDHILCDEAVYSEHMDDHILEDESIEYYGENDKLLYVHEYDDMVDNLIQLDGTYFLASIDINEVA